MWCDLLLEVVLMLQVLLFMCTNPILSIFLSAERKA